MKETDEKPVEIGKAVFCNVQSKSFKTDWEGNLCLESFRLNLQLI